jgi:hypothetical protein
MSPRPCSVDGCEKKVKARDLCETHYMRLRRNGSPDIVRPKCPPTVHPGDGYGRLTVIECVGCDARGERQYRCACDCGGETVVRSDNLRGQTRSCGCLQAERARPWEERFRFADHHERGSLMLEVPADLDDAAYWRAVASAWQDCERQSLTAAQWRALLTAQRAGREQHLMTSEERQELAALPERVTVHRGVHAYSYATGGLSWTLDRTRAVWFAQRFPSPEWPGVVITGQVLRHRIVALFQARGESEVLVFPRFVRDRQWTAHRLP